MDEGSNLNTMTTTLKSIVSCDMLGLEESFWDTYFGDACSKACQYTTTKLKNYKDLLYVLIKSSQGDLQKCIIWLNFLGKGRQEWEKGMCIFKFSHSKFEYSSEDKVNF